MKIKTRLFSIVVLVVSAVVVWFTLTQMTTSAIANDDGLIYELALDRELTGWAWMVLLCCVALMILAAFDLVLNGRLTRHIVSKAAVTALLMAAVVVGAMANVQIYRNIDTVAMNAIDRNVTSFTLTDFAVLKESGVGPIFVKRDDCQDCVEVEAELYAYLYEENEHMFVYSTSQDRDSENSE